MFAHPSDKYSVYEPSRPDPYDYSEPVPRPAKKQLTVRPSTPPPSKKESFMVSPGTELTNLLLFVFIVLLIVGIVEVRLLRQLIMVSIRDRELSTAGVRN